MKLIYLASPYSHPDPKVVEQRYLAAVEKAAELIKAGFMVFSPIAHTHPIAVRHKLPGEFDYWEAYDRRMISHCDLLYILTIPGWRESRGVQAEIQIARDLGIDVSIPEDLPDPTLCMISDCGRPRRTRKYCKAHWARWQRGGSFHADIPVGRLWKGRFIGS